MLFQKKATIKKHQKFDKRIQMKDQGFIHTVIVPWYGQDNKFWNEMCASVVEVFGLPGNRFMYHPTMDEMTFAFKNIKDKQLCEILLSERLQ